MIRTKANDAIRMVQVTELLELVALEKARLANAGITVRQQSVPRLTVQHIESLEGRKALISAIKQGFSLALGKISSVMW